MSYSARAAADLIGLPESAIRNLIRDGVIGVGADVPPRLTFRDLATLRVIKGVFDAGIPMRRARRELAALARRIGSGRSLAEVSLDVHGGRICVRGEGPAVGQLELAFEPVAAAPTMAGEVCEMPARPAAAELTVVAPLTADEWLQKALVLEETDTQAAIDAYRRSLRLRPDSTESWINLGRLYAESNNAGSARECFQAALDLDPSDATAVYNLGVVAQDSGREEEAVEMYRRALDLDPGLAEAHYNLATLFDQTGDSRAAIRHINEYRKLTR